MKRIVRYFFQGLLILVPISISIYIIAVIFIKVGELLHRVGITIHPYVDPIIGLLTVFGFILLVGWIGSSIIVQPILLLFDRLVEKTPVVKTLYSSVKDLLSAFVGSKKKFDRPVLVLTSKESNIQQLGFITQTDLRELGIKEDKVAVYIPMSYSLSGHLWIVPRDRITPVEHPPGETMKFIVSGGVTDLD
ncbi:MAG: DUF502 domain-containing protein [Bacteroidota bacterium]